LETFGARSYKGVGICKASHPAGALLAAPERYGTDSAISITNTGTTGASPMCNQVCRTKPDEDLAAEAHLPAPMEVDDRPCEAILAGSRLCLCASR